MLETLESRRLLAAIEVTTSLDVVADDGLVSLREAIDLANQDGEADTITFATTLFNSDSVTIELNGTGMQITSPVKLLGPGADRLILDAQFGSDGVFETGDGFRHFHIADGDANGLINVTIAGVTLTGGDVASNDLLGRGGAILNEENLILREVYVHTNAALDGGGVGNADGGIVTLVRSTVYGNVAAAPSGDGGGIWNASGAGLHVLGSTISSNVADTRGGGIASLGAVTVSQSTITENFAGTDGGGVYDSADSQIINGSIVSGNTAGGSANNLLGDFSGDHNLLGTGDASGGANDVFSDSPGVGALGNNGGPTPTHALMNDSLAINAGAMGTTNLLVNGDFETADLTGWTFETSDASLGFAEINDGTVDTLAADDPYSPISGSSDVVLRDTGPNTRRLYQDILVPAGIAEATLSWSDRIINNANQFVDPQQGFRVFLEDSTGRLLDEVFSTQPGDPVEQLGPNSRGFDVTKTLQQHEGESLRLTFYVQNELLALQVWLDDIELSVLQADQRGGGFYRNDGFGVDIGAFELQTELDFGDAPVGYPVMLPDGASHAVGSLTLGGQIDSEPNGLADDAADGDGADDDGVIMIADMVSRSDAATTSSFSVFASASGFLDAWIDFDQDQSWDDAGEQIAVSVPVNLGQNTLSFAVPAGAVAGNTFARFRLSSSGGLTPTGSAIDGEVEDYVATILDGSSVQNLQVDLPHEDAILRIDGPDLVLQSSGKVLFQAPNQSVGLLNILGTSDADQFIIDFSGGILPATVSQELRLNGGGGDDLLTIMGGDGTIDFTDNGNVTITGFNTIDLGTQHAHSITLDSEAWLNVRPATGDLTILGGVDDTITFVDRSAWLMGPTSIEGGRFLRSAVQAGVTETQSLLFDLAAPWQNIIRPGDVNNNGMVTAGDALDIINELKNHAYSDATTLDLLDPMNVAQWPGVYYDQTGDGRVTANDALQVINELRAIRLGEVEPEFVDLDENGLRKVIALGTAIDQALVRFGTTLHEVQQEPIPAAIVVAMLNASMPNASLARPSEVGAISPAGEVATNASTVDQVIDQLWLEDELLSGSVVLSLAE
ncbi:hypothetical protein Pla52n_47430 [Stieleria varia]|uniref:GEVED domain-containing protein n=2 Tax=Stieleria varia TaxID=2528005 RepID=A0A5C6AJ23_9BACT|nr:hypothetical protein Pla52n_47430 [Stieleria varia]